MLVAWCSWAATMKTKPVEGCCNVCQVQFSFSTSVGFLLIICGQKDVQLKSNTWGLVRNSTWSALLSPVMETELLNSSLWILKSV